MIYINITNFVLISWLEKDHSIVELCHWKNVIIFTQTILSFVLSMKIINIYNISSRKYGNVTVKGFRKYENHEYKKNKLKLDINFLNNCKQLGVYPKFLIFKLPNVSNKDALSIHKLDSFVAPSISVIKNSNIFQKNSVYPKTFYLNSFLLLTSTSLQNLYHHITRNHIQFCYYSISLYVISYSIISALIISIFYCLDYTSLSLHLFITHLVIDFIITV